MTQVIKKEKSEIPLFGIFGELRNIIVLIVYDWQFDWGGRLLKSNEGVQR